MKQGGILADRPDDGHGRHMTHRLATLLALRRIGVHDAPFLRRERNGSLSHRRLFFWCVVGDVDKPTPLASVPRVKTDHCGQPKRTTDIKRTSTVVAVLVRFDVGG